MFLDTLPGLNKVFETDIPEGMVILVTGGPGTLKSAFVYNIMSAYLDNNKKEFGSYVTLEETKKSHMRNMKSLNIKMQKRLKVADLASFRSSIGYEDLDYLALVKSRALKKARINPKKQEEKSFEFDSLVGTDEAKDNDVADDGRFKSPRCFGLDSLNALYSLMNITGKEIRQEMLKFFQLLKDSGLTSFILLETGPDETYKDEYFLVEGIIELGIKETAGQHRRYLKVKKMRATKHKLEPYVIDLTKSGIRIVGEVQE